MKDGSAVQAYLAQRAGRDRVTVPQVRPARCGTPTPR
jgi:hypothetical protein